MAGKSTQWTNQQLAAITDRNHDVLVTASAGTGKTAVLSGRVVEILSEPQSCPDVKSIVVMTFTEAAAAEMKTRIAGALKDKYLASRDAHLRRQLLMIEAADISTIHSFCKRLISEFFYKLGIDPTFKIIPEDEQKLVKADILEEVIKSAHEDESLRAGLIELLNGRRVQGSASFLSNILTIHDYLDGVSSRGDWYARAQMLCSMTKGCEGPIAEKQVEILLKKLRTCVEQLRHAVKLDGRLAGGHWTDQIESDMIEPIESCIRHARNGRLDKCAEEIEGYVKAKWANRPKGLEDEIVEAIKGPANKAIENFKSLAELAVLNPRYEEIIGRCAGRQTAILIELVKRFDKRYREVKKGLNCLDFADLEHYALELLTKPGTDEASESAMELRKRYKYIFVDEYQDVNWVQQSILSRLSTGDNVFVVGDVKQSIYSWRQAQPSIFITRLDNASSDPGKAINGLRVDLTGNFRSRKGVLDFANTVFSRIMTRSFADIDYDKSAMLEAKAQYKPLDEVFNGGQVKAPVELYLLSEDREETECDTGAESDDVLSLTKAEQRQAGFIARRIKQMVEGREFEILDRETKAYRPVDYRDIVILIRSVTKKSNDYADILRLWGVPVSSQSTSGYFEATEITDFISLLCVLDNPQRDIEFAAVLRSPFFNVSDTELLKIRHLSDKAGLKCNYHDAARFYVENGTEPGLREKLSGVFEQLENWRTYARRQSLADLIWVIMQKTGYLAFVSALPNGSQRHANLLKLHQRAIQFEGFLTSAKTVSLTRFVEFIEGLLEKGQDWSQCEPENSAENAVSIMSVHKSKGLEFAVVFLAELNTRLNKQDLYGQCLIDGSDAIGLEVIESKSKLRLPSIAHQVIAESREAVALAEEMRVLYVALTRARERLIITSSITRSRCFDLLMNASAVEGQTIPDWMLAGASCSLDWLLYALSDQKCLLDEMGISYENAKECEFHSRLVNRGELEEISTQIQELRKSRRKGQVNAGDEIVPEARARFEQIKESIGWKYSFEGLSRLRAKTSVSKLSHRDDEFAQGQYEQVLSEAPNIEGLWSSSQGRDARLVGTATHLVLQRIDLSRPVTQEAVRQEIERLVTSKAISEQAAKYIRVSAITGFFESELGRMVMGAKRISREWPFSYAMPVSCLVSQCPEGGEDVVVVQGIIDLLAETDGGLVIVDFKTDHVGAGQARAKAAVYAEQLNLYGQAAEAIQKRPVKGRYLYFLSAGEAVEV